MVNKRRDLLKYMGLIAGSGPLLNMTALSQGSTFLPSQLSAGGDSGGDTNNEDFWSWVNQSYTSSANIINLNNGGVSPQPKFVQEAFETYNRLSNEAPAYYMWQILDQGREPLRYKLADLAGTSPDELAINRNTTEALNNIIFGLDLKPGDEVVLTKQDYPNVLNSWKQREKRDGIRIVWVNLNLPIENDDEILQEFEKAYTNRTRVVNITHMINWTGQLLPARKLADAAHKREIEVIVDAAHTFAHIDFKIPDLDCDYLGTSLHKWLCAPFGTGLLYIKKEKINKIWPMFPNPEPESGDIRKFEAMGTRSFPTEMAISHAINFHLSIGIKRKEARLRYLKNYWAEKVVQMPKVKLLTSLKPDYSCALANFSVDGKKPGEISSYLFDKHRIHTVAIEWENISGVRVTPHVYTRLADLDKFVSAVAKFLKQ